LDGAILGSIGALLAAGVFGGLLARGVGLSPILGYLAAGVGVGPHLLDVAPGGPALDFLGELGVAFLLFDVGLHFSLKDLWRSQRRLLLLAPLQMLAATALLGGAALLGDAALLPALALGATLALSSTAVAIQGLRERGDAEQPLGRAATSILIFQDLAAVLLISLVGAAGAPAAGGLGPLAGAAAALVGVALLGRAVRPLFAAVTRPGSEETFTAAALLVVIGTGWLTQQAGLSLPLGAFLAGMVLSESEYCYMVKTELRPFRGLLLGLFFLTVGVHLELPLVLASGATVLWLTGLLLLAKVATTALAALACGLCPGFALRLGVTLAQGSEFALVVLPLAAAVALVEAETAALLSASVVLSMALSPLLPLAATRLCDAIERRSAERETQAAPAAASAGRVVLDGTGPLARLLASALADHGVDYVALEPDPRRLARARSEGFRAALGSVRSPALVETAAAGRPRLLVLGPPSPDPAMLRELRRRHPSLGVLHVAPGGEPDAALHEAGATVLEARGDDWELAVARRVLALAGVDDAALTRWLDASGDSPWEKADKAHAA
jgi:CPA2 family monovalent cation:H+ antiporter-2